MEGAPLLGRAGRARVYRNHTPTPKRQTRLALAAILLTETFERIAFYGIGGNLVMFLNLAPYYWTFYNATNAHFIFTGMSYMSSLLGGWIADSYLGKFRTIVLFFIMYIIGFVFFPLLYPYPNISRDVTHVPRWCTSGVPSVPVQNSTNVSQIDVTQDWTKIDKTSRSSPGSEPCAWAVYLALSLIAVGTGAVKANISPFGAEQIKHEGPAAIRMFVNWFYWCINIGALIALGGLAYIQQEISFFWGFVAPNISLVIATVIFVAGVCMYKTKPPTGSILTNIVKIVHQSCGRSCRRPQTYGLVRGSVDIYADPPRSCLDYAKIQYGGSYHDNMVDDVKTLGKVLLIFTAMVPYWIVYFQMQTTFVFQGLHMRLNFDSNGTKAAAEERTFKIPAAWLSLFDVIFLIILLPIFDALYPVLDRRGYVLSPRLRIVMGMLFATAAVAAAGMVEMYRLDVYWQNGTEHTYYQLIDETFYRAADVSVLMQIPQYALIGVSEVFASVAGLELAYVLAPRSMQGLITGLFWFSQGVGSVLGTVIIYAFRGTWFFRWDHGDINCRNQPCGTEEHPRTCSCHLDYYFFFLAGLQLVGVFIFSLVAWRLDVGLQSAIKHQNVNTDTQTGPNPGNTLDTHTRPGYRTFVRRSPEAHRRHPVQYARNDSETDTLDTDGTLDPH